MVPFIGFQEQWTKRHWPALPPPPCRPNNAAALGLEETCPDEEEAQGSGHSSEIESMCSGSLTSGVGGRARGSGRMSVKPGSSAQHWTTQSSARI